MTPEFMGTGLPGTATSISVVVDGLETVEDGSMTLEKKASILTGIANVQSLSLATYPNPTSNTILFTIAGNSSKGTLKMLNQTGTIQLQKELDLNGPITIDIENFPAGVYLLQVTTANEIYTSKVIKN